MPGLVVSYDLRPENRVDLFSKEKVNKEVSWIGKEKQVEIKGSKWGSQAKKQTVQIICKYTQRKCDDCFLFAKANPSVRHFPVMSKWRNSGR